MRIFKHVLLGVLALVVLAIGAGLVWALNPSPAEPGTLETALSDPRVRVETEGRFLVLTPTNRKPETGILFYPGMHVSSEAYVHKLAELVKRAGVAVVIGRPPLGMAFFSIDQADELKSLLPDMARWYVAGHSLGGAMACLYASTHQDRLDGVVLWATYCGSDLSQSQLRVLSVSGSNDGLFSTEAILAKRAELPPHAVIEIVEGMNHAQFANYGEQFGDKPASISDSEALEAFISRTAAFLGDRS